jgi:hypothetical protein
MILRDIEESVLRHEFHVDLQDERRQYIEQKADVTKRVLRAQNDRCGTKKRI